MAEALMETRVVHGSRGKAMLLLATSALFVTGFVAMALDGQPLEVWWWLGVVLFGLGIPLSLLLAVRPPALTLSSQRFEVADSFGRRWSVDWRSIEALELWTNPAPRARQQLVAWRLKPGAPRKKLMAVNRRLFDIDASLPGMWTLGPRDLLALMQAYHRAATASAPDA